MNVIWEQDGGVGRVTLNRPDSLNAWTDELGHELKQVITGDAADQSVRAVLITGAGRGFSSRASTRIRTTGCRTSARSSTSSTTRSSPACARSRSPSSPP
jgi:2-(1,2-epoxy-1,2-dihydrophenyl)acetyl-CoA isomerase